eukprot:scaffold3400_cov169-Amphora_coffeaeformis.AAC.19
MISQATKNQAFLAWCTAQGITGPLTLQQRADTTLSSVSSPYRFTQATRDIDADTPLLRIPIPQTCLTAETHEELADLLVHEQKLGGASLYAPYLDVLPTLADFQETLPRFWDPKRLASITDGGWVESLVNTRNEEDVDPWAISCIRSRANYIVTSQQPSSSSSSSSSSLLISMSPLLDMINHNAAITTKAKVVDDTLIITTNQSFAVGEEVVISYGELTNLETLVDYGFVATTTNPHNEESVHVKVMTREPTLSSTLVRVTVQANGVVDDLSLATLRQALANPQELAAAVDNGPLAFWQPLSDRNEMEVSGLLSAYLYDAAESARAGSLEVGRKDPVVQTYLLERALLLERAVQRLDEALEAAL